MVTPESGRTKQWNFKISRKQNRMIILGKQSFISTFIIKKQREIPGGRGGTLYIPWWGGAAGTVIP